METESLILTPTTEVSNATGEKLQSGSTGISVK